MTGMILGAARHQIAIVIDGFISTAAAAVACGLAPAVRGYLFAGHQSQEPGHRILLAHLNLEPILDLHMRLGEGSGQCWLCPSWKPPCGFTRRWPPLLPQVLVEPLP